MPSLSIGQMARQAGVGIDTIRFYEREGLLAEPRRRTSGYRDYPAESLQRLRFIRRAKALAFSLREIRELLALHGSSPAGCAEAAARAREKIAAIEAKIRGLEAVRAGLGELAAACERRATSERCPLLEALLGAPEHQERLETAR
jgi:MerR family transcriptional regulator, copper efflux regulator